MYLAYMFVFCIIVLLICLLLDKFIKSFRPHKHTMIIEKSVMETAEGIKKAVRKMSHSQLEEQRLTIFEDYMASLTVNTRII